MKFIVAGTRPPLDIRKDRDLYKRWMLRLSIESWWEFSSVVIPEHEVTGFIGGEAQGPDELAPHFAWTLGVPYEPFPADWGKEGWAAGFIRNTRMAERANALFLVWDGRSRGSEHMKKEMVRRGLLVVEFVITDWRLGL